MKFDLTIEVSGDRELEVEIDVALGMDGIGAYECHGYKGYDAGQLCIEGYTVVSVTGKDGPVAVDAEIEAAIESEFERRDADIYEAYGEANDGSDYPDKEPEDRETEAYYAADDKD